MTDTSRHFQSGGSSATTKRSLRSPVIEDVDPNYVPPDAYFAKCVDVFEDTSKKGNKMWVWDFTITKGPHAGKDLRMWTALTEAALWKLDDVMTGLQQVKDPSTKQYDLDIDALMTWELILVIEDNDFEGKMKSSVAGVYRASNPEAPDVSPINRGEAKAPPEPYDPGDYSPTGADDDIPF